MGRPKHEQVKLDDITINEGIQQRAGGLDRDTVHEYAERMKDGDQFDAITLFRDPDGKLWLADGFHRVHARVIAGQENENGDLGTIKAVVKVGTKRDAILYACGANADHGKQRTNDDKRRAVRTLLADKEWAEWSDHVIADKCRVSHPFVGKVRKEIEADEAEIAKGVTSSPTPATVTPVKRRGKDGKVRTVKPKPDCRPKVDNASAAVGKACRAALIATGKMPKNPQAAFHHQHAEDDTVPTDTCPDCMAEVAKPGRCQSCEIYERIYDKVMPAIVKAFTEDEGLAALSKHKTIYRRQERPSPYWKQCHEVWESLKESFLGELFDEELPPEETK